MYVVLFYISGIYLTCTMAITTLSMVLTVFVLNLHHITDRPVPMWIRQFILVYLAKMMGIGAKPGDKHCKKAKTSNNVISNHMYRRASLCIETDGEERTAILEMLPNTSNGGERTNFNPTHNSRFPSPVYSPIEQPPAKENHDIDFAKDWRRVAEVFDRLFFWLFLLAILISTLVLFHPLTDSYLNRGKKRHL